MVKKNKLGQGFSTDVIIVVIIILFGTLFLVVNQLQKTESVSVDQRYETASLNADNLFNTLKNKEVIDQENRIDLAKLSQLDFEELRESGALSGEFAIAFEKDGNLIKVDSSSDITCIGSSNIIINDINCK